MGTKRFSPTVRGLVWLCLLGLLVLAFPGCVPVAPAREPVTISFEFPEVDAERYEALVLKFNEKHPQITVDLRPKSWQELYTMEAERADALWISQDLAAQLATANKIVNLGSLIEQDEAFDLDDFYPGLVDALSYEGKTWGIPYGADVVVMYYNRDLFDQYSAAYPQVGWTWDDFLECAVALRDPDARIFGYGPRLDLGDPTFFIYQHGGRIFDNLDEPTRTTFDDPLTIEALEWYARMVHEYDAAPSLNQSSHAYGGGSYAIYQGIRTGKVGMWMGGLSERGGLTWPFKWNMGWGMVPLPSGAQSATQATVEGYAISANTEHHDACWEWISWLSEQAPYRLMPARRALAESSDYEELVGAEAAAVARASIENALTFNPMNFGLFEDILDDYDEALRDILQGFATPMEAMDELQRKSP